MTPVARLNELAAKHSLPPISLGMDPGAFMDGALSIMMTALKLTPERVSAKEAAQIASRMVNRKDKELYDPYADEFVPNPFYRPDNG